MICLLRWWWQYGGSIMVLRSSHHLDSLLCDCSFDVRMAVHHHHHHHTFHNSHMQSSAIYLDLSSIILTFFPHLDEMRAQKKTVADNRDKKQKMRTKSTNSIALVVLHWTQRRSYFQKRQSKKWQEHTQKKRPLIDSFAKKEKFESNRLATKSRANGCGCPIVKQKIFREKEKKWRVEILHRQNKESSFVYRRYLLAFLFFFFLFFSIDRLLLRFVVVGSDLQSSSRWFRCCERMTSSPSSSSAS